MNFNSFLQSSAQVVAQIHRPPSGRAIQLIIVIVMFALMALYFMNAFHLECKEYDDKGQCVKTLIIKNKKSD